MIILKRAYLSLQRPLYLAAQARGELQKYVGGVEIYLSLITYLAVIGFKLSPVSAILLFAILTIFAIFVGYILMKMGVIAYNTQLANEQNPELKEILIRLERIEAKIK
jgi:hypothetical protein